MRRHQRPVEIKIKELLSEMAEIDQVYSWRRGKHLLYFNKLSVLYIYKRRLAECRRWHKPEAIINVFMYTLTLVSSGMGRAALKYRGFVKWDRSKLYCTSDKEELNA